MTSANENAVMSRRVLLSIASLVFLLAAPSAAVAHSDIPESDAACTEPVLLNDDLPPVGRTADAAHAHRIVSARAEIVGMDGVPVGTLYLDDRGERYAAFARGTPAAVVADFLVGPGGAPPAGADGGVPLRLSRAFELGARYRLAACR